MTLLARWRGIADCPGVEYSALRWQSRHSTRCSARPSRGAKEASRVREVRPARAIRCSTRDPGRFAISACQAVTEPFRQKSAPQPLAHFKKRPWRPQCHCSCRKCVPNRVYCVGASLARVKAWLIAARCIRQGWKVISQKIADCGFDVFPRMRREQPGHLSGHFLKSWRWASMVRCDERRLLPLGNSSRWRSITWCGNVNHRRRGRFDSKHR